MLYDLPRHNQFIYCYVLFASLRHQPVYSAQTMQVPFLFQCEHAWCMSTSRTLHICAQFCLSYCFSSSCIVHFRTLLWCRHDINRVR